MQATLSDQESSVESPVKIEGDVSEFSAQEKSNGCRQYAIIQNGDVICHPLDEVFMNEWLDFKDKFQDDYIKYKSGERELNGEQAHFHSGKDLAYDQAQEFIDEVFKIYVEQKIIRSACEKEYSEQEIQKKDIELIQNFEADRYLPHARQ